MPEKKTTKTSKESTCREMSSEELLKLLSHPNTILTRVPSSPTLDAKFWDTMISTLSEKAKNGEF